MASAFCCVSLLLLLPFCPVSLLLRLNLSFAQLFQMFQLVSHRNILLAEKHSFLNILFLSYAKKENKIPQKIITNTNSVFFSAE